MGEVAEVELPSSGVSQMQTFVSSEIMPANNFGKMGAAIGSGQLWQFNDNNVIPACMLGSVMLAFWLFVLGGCLWDRRQDKQLRAKFEANQKEKLKAGVQVWQKQMRKQEAVQKTVVKSPEDSALDASAAPVAFSRVRAAAAGVKNRIAARGSVAQEGEPVEMQSRTEGGELLEHDLEDSNRGWFSSQNKSRRVSTRGPSPTIMAQFHSNRERQAYDSDSQVSPRGSRRVSMKFPDIDKQQTRHVECGAVDGDDRKASIATSTARRVTLPISAAGEEEPFPRDASFGGRHGSRASDSGISVDPDPRTPGEYTKETSSASSPRNLIQQLSAPPAPRTNASDAVMKLRRALQFVKYVSRKAEPEDTTHDVESSPPRTNRRASAVPPRDRSVSVAQARRSSMQYRRRSSARRPSMRRASLAGSVASPHCVEESIDDRKQVFDEMAKGEAVGALGPSAVHVEEEPSCCKKFKSWCNDALISMKAHTWLCFIFRAPGEAYKRSQRATVLFTFMLTVLFILCVFHGNSEKNKGLMRTASSACLTALLLMPVVVILQLLFRRSRKKLPVVWQRTGDDLWRGKPVVGELVVRVREAHNLPNLDADTGDADDVSDPYVRVDFEDKTWKSDTIWNDLNPVYDARQVVSFPVRDGMDGELHFTVMDDDGNQCDTTSELIGGVTLTMGYIKDYLSTGDVGATAVLEGWFDLDSDVIQQTGCDAAVRLIIEYTQYSKPRWDKQSDAQWAAASKKGELAMQVVDMGRFEPAHEEDTPPVLPRAPPPAACAAAPAERKEPKRAKAYKEVTVLDPSCSAATPCSDVSAHTPEPDSPSPAAIHPITPATPAQVVSPAFGAMSFLSADSAEAVVPTAPELPDTMAAEAVMGELEDGLLLMVHGANRLNKIGYVKKRDTTFFSDITDRATLPGTYVVEIIRSGKAPCSCRTNTRDISNTRINEAVSFPLPNKLACGGWLRPRDVLLDRMSFGVQVTHTVDDIDHIIGTGTLSLSATDLDGQTRKHVIELGSGSASSPRASAKATITVFIKAKWPTESDDDKKGTVDRMCLKYFDIDLERSRKEWSTSAKFIAFLALTHIAIASLGGWTKPPMVFFVIGLFLCLATATYLLLFVRALMLFLVMLGLYG
eukprot:Hpha_TRINITY_DN15901_c2_g3::TRINITY_DN15901_c2_g3_i1::g.74077::m.74077